jgi:ribonuclease HI
VIPSKKIGLGSLHRQLEKQCFQKFDVKSHLETSTKLPWHKIWSKIQRNISEMLKPKYWIVEDLTCDPEERLILLKWDLCLGPDLDPPPSHPPLVKSLDKWMHSPHRFFKLNFDGDSKGNPRPTGFGVVIWDDQGLVQHILSDNLSHKSNNAIELWVLICGIQVASQIGIQQLIVEGDSHIILALFSKLIIGSEPAKISASWRLLINLNFLQSLLLSNLVLVPFHVRWETNNIADKLTNEGVNKWEQDRSCRNDQRPVHPLFLECMQLAL